MKVSNMSIKKFNSLKKLELGGSIYNEESDLFIIEGKNKWERQDLLFKKLRNDYGGVFSNKLYTINELITCKDIINIEEIVMPRSLCSIGGEIKGFTMDYIESINLSLVLSSDCYSISDKIRYLKQIGEILEKMKNVRNYTSVHDFYLNDLHENNFIVNLHTDRVNVVDIDSSKINDNQTFISRRLTPFSKISSVSKYVKEESALGGVYKIDYNTEMYCYIMIILNYLSEYRINNLSIEEYFCYMEYLHNIGYSYEFVDMLARIYMEKDNVNPYMLLDEIESYKNESGYKKYLLKR